MRHVVTGVALALLACVPAAAQTYPVGGLAPPPQVPTSTATAQADTTYVRCSPFLREDAVAARNRLMALGEVFGKAALTWTPDDYDGVIMLARSCSGYKSGTGGLVDAAGWENAMVTARAKTLPLAELARGVVAYGASLGVSGVTLPRCERFLDYKADRYSGSDSSKDLFGVSFMSMTDEDLGKVVLYVNQCAVYLPEFAWSQRVVRNEVTQETLNAIMDQALIVQKRRREFASLERRDTDLVVRLDGTEIPTTFLAKETREMVSRFNKATALRRRFTPETVAILSKMSETVVQVDRSLYDRVYGEAVQKRIQEEIWQRQ